jgi:hypothetical protein
MEQWRGPVTIRGTHDSFGATVPFEIVRDVSLGRHPNEPTGQVDAFFNGESATTLECSF